LLPLPVNDSSGPEGLVQVALSAPPPAVLTLEPVERSAGSEIAFSDPGTMMPVASLAVSAGPAAANVDGERDWWITGAVKRTGTHIARTGAKTGASFRDLFRRVNRAVRRALPDFSAVPNPFAPDLLPQFPVAYFGE
jgi:hypothetical protein